MPQPNAPLQILGATLLLALALACGGKKDEAPPPASTEVTLRGTVTYQRVPLNKDAQGLPLGLKDATVAANLQTLPARNTMVRVYQQIEQTLPDNTKVMVWILAASNWTDKTGLYSFTVIKDRPTMVEILSSFIGGGGNTIHLVAEAGGINSPTLAANRLRYALRKAADGTAPAGDATPSSTLSADATVDFSVGLNDAWWVMSPAIRSNSEAPLLDQAVLETSIAGHATGTGSRVLGVGDSIASFLTTYGNAVPGGTLDLHYWTGRSEPRGSYIEYDRSLFPQAYDPSAGASHFFGSLRGGPGNDDAWDEGVIFPLLARNALFASNASRTYSMPLNPMLPVGVPLTDLSPDLARVEGLAEAMAANLLKSPYLADTQGTTLASPPLDIRDISGLGAAQLSPFSAPALRALAWEIVLKANSLPSPEVLADWDKIDPAAAMRFFAAPGFTGGATTPGRDIEPLNIYNQLDRLKESRSALDPVDLAPLFTDAVLTPLTAPFGIPWPRPTVTVPPAPPHPMVAYASFAKDWGTDPNSTTTPLDPLTFSMANAVQVNGAYPNVSQGEVVYGGFSLTTDKRYVITATLSPALAAGAEVELDLPLLPRTFTFTGTGQSTEPLMIPMGASSPTYHPVRLRLKNPGSIHPDVTVTLAFTPAP